MAEPVTGVPGVPVLQADGDGIDEAVRRLRAGGLVALPTETVYGLAASATDASAVARIFAVKGRPTGHPLIVHLHDASDLPRWAAHVPDWAAELGNACWPGPLTIVVARTGLVPDAVTGGRDTVGLRVPDHPVALAVLAAAGPLAAPSANRFGSVSPTTAAHVVADLADRLDPAHDAVLDGGPCRVGIESTIVDATAGDPVILRPGAVTAEEIEAVTGRPVHRTADGPRVPGMLPAHYAPRAEIVVVDPGEPWSPRGRTGYLGPGRPPTAWQVVVLDTPQPYRAEAIAPVLYARFRDADALGLDRLVVERPPAVGIGDAVIDRLLRAATGSRREH